MKTSLLLLLLSINSFSMDIVEIHPCEKKIEAQMFTRYAGAEQGVSIIEYFTLYNGVVCNRGQQQCQRQQRQQQAFQQDRQQQYGEVLRYAGESRNITILSTGESKVFKGKLYKCLEH